MGAFSATHLIIVLVIVLLLFGAKRIPELAKGLGTGMKELRRGMSDDAEKNEEKANSEGEGPRGDGSRS